MPISFTVTLLGTLSMAGVPPLNGFLSKELFFTTMWQSKEALSFGTVVFVSIWLASVFTFIYSLYFVCGTFLGKRHKARGFVNGEELMKALKEEIPELILLDIMLPGDDGYTILEKLKSMSTAKNIPVIMVTAKEAEFDKVKGLESGADDYITKPFGMMEFIARVKAVLRRSARQNEDKELHYEELYLNVGRHEVRYREEKIELTRKEFELLQYLMENKGLVMTRNQILCHVWGYDFDGETRTVDVHVRTLRQKLGEAGSLIETVRGVGYRIGA